MTSRILACFSGLIWFSVVLSPSAAASSTEGVNHLRAKNMPEYHVSFQSSKVAILHSQSGNCSIRVGMQMKNDSIGLYYAVYVEVWGRFMPPDDQIQIEEFEEPASRRILAKALANDKFTKLPKEHLLGQYLSMYRENPGFLLRYLKRSTASGQPVKLLLAVLSRKKTSDSTWCSSLSGYMYNQQSADRGRIGCPPQYKPETTLPVAIKAFLSSGFTGGAVAGVVSAVILGVTAVFLILRFLKNSGGLSWIGQPAAFEPVSERPMNISAPELVSCSPAAFATLRRLSALGNSPAVYKNMGLKPPAESVLP